jgi:hypothetical protein
MHRQSDIFRLSVVSQQPPPHHSNLNQPSHFAKHPLIHIYQPPTNQNAVTLRRRALRRRGCQRPRPRIQALPFHFHLALSTAGLKCPAFADNTHCPFCEAGSNPDHRKRSRAAPSSNQGKIHFVLFLPMQPREDTNHFHPSFFL